jgi:hypothetical protein
MADFLGALAPVNRKSSAQTAAEFHETRGVDDTRDTFRKRFEPT